MKINKRCFRTFIQKTNFRCELSMSNLEISLHLSDISFENSRGLSNFRFDWNNRRFENSTNFERNFVSPEILLYFVEKYRKVAKFGEIRLHSFCTVLYLANNNNLPNCFITLLLHLNCWDNFKVLATRISLAPILFEENSCPQNMHPLILKIMVKCSSKNGTFLLVCFD